MPATLKQLRRYAVARNFPKPTTLKRALSRMGFLQADPIRAPARAQDLILHQRVKDYHAGDLERMFDSLDVEEDFFVNYGYVTHSLQLLMHPRSNSRVPADDNGKPWPAEQKKKASLLLEFVRERGTVHPREVDQFFPHGKVTNYWGGSSNATTHLLDAMHYLGLLRVVRREKGIRLYTVHEHPSLTITETERRANMDVLVDTVVNIYAPLSRTSLSYYIRRLRFAAPQWRDEIPGAFQRATNRLRHVIIEDTDWYFPEKEKITGGVLEDRVRLLAPFDPLVHDRARFEFLWGWMYRFEAYTPVQKRKLGYYAMPLLWRDKVIGWANISMKSGKLDADFGYVESKPRELAFKRELEAELERMRMFLNANNQRANS
jgi:uncharacterized protein YcaQ